MLPHDEPFIFYHEGLRAFSVAIHGGEYFREYEIDIEWQDLLKKAGFIFTANRHTEATKRDTHPQYENIYSLYSRA